MRKLIFGIALTKSSSEMRIMSEEDADMYIKALIQSEQVDEHFRDLTKYIHRARVKMGETLRTYTANNLRFMSDEKAKRSWKSSPIRHPVSKNKIFDL